MSNISKGTKVFLKPVNNLARRSTVIESSEIVSVGRIYFKVKHPKGYSKEIVFNIDGLHEKSDYSADYELYFSLDDAENSSKVYGLKSEIISGVKKLRYTDLSKINDFIKSL